MRYVSYQIHINFIKKIPLSPYLVNDNFSWKSLNNRAIAGGGDMKLKQGKKEKGTVLVKKKSNNTKYNHIHK